MKLREKMDTFVYGQGYTIRKTEANIDGQYDMLIIRKGGSFEFVKYSDGVHSGRFLSERGAQDFMTKNGLSADEYEVVKAKSSRFLRLVDENYGLYKVIKMEDRELNASGVPVKYFDDAGNIQDYPNIPQSIKKSSKSIVHYLLEATAGIFWAKHLRNIKYDDVNTTDCILSTYIISEPNPTSFNVYFENTLTFKDNADDDLISYLSKKLKFDDNEGIKTKVGIVYPWGSTSLEGVLRWEVILTFNLTDLFKASIFKDKLPELTKMSDKDLDEIKKQIEHIEELRNEKSIFDRVILKRVNEVYSSLINKFKELTSNFTEYSNTEVLENLSLKELFEKIYYEE